MKLFNQPNYEPTEPVQLTIHTADLGKFAITGSYLDVEPLYEQAMRAEKPRRHVGAYALSGF